MMDIESDPYPKGSKGDWMGHVEALIQRDKAGDPDALKSLLQWLKDANWPASGVASRYLQSVGPRAIPLVRAVLQTRDETWIFNVVEDLISSWPRETQADFVPALKKFTEEPLGGGWMPDLDVAAAGILCESKLLPLDELKTIVARVIRNNPHLDDDDIAALEAYVKDA